MLLRQTLKEGYLKRYRLFTHTDTRPGYVHHSCKSQKGVRLDFIVRIPSTQCSYCTLVGTLKLYHRIILKLQFQTQQLPFAGIQSGMRLTIPNHPLEIEHMHVPLAAIILVRDRIGTVPIEAIHSYQRIHV